MKYILFLSLILPIVAFTQGAELFFKETFQDNINRWTQTKEFDYEVYHNTFHIDPDTDFELQAIFEVVDLDAESVYGFSWGREGAYSFQQIDFNKAGAFRIGYQKDATFNVQQGWKKKKCIKSRGVNVLRIRRKGAKLFFYVNDKLVHKRPYKRFDASGVAFRTTTKGVSYGGFTIDQKKAPIYLLTSSGDSVWTGKNLGSKVNSPYIDKYPRISPDGQFLYFLREDPADGFGSQDIYRSEKIDNEWTPAENVQRPINNRYANFVCGVMADNNTLLLSNAYKNYNEENLLAFTFKGENGWEDPTPVRIQKLQKKGRWVSFTLSSDGRVLIFSMVRPDTYGGRDLYVSFRLANGDFSKPKNLGETINTIGNEHCPFLAADGKTLYFDTDGHPGYGGRDIFMTRRLDDSWKNWAEPANMGQGINTKESDEGFTIDAQSGTGYIVSNRSGEGRLDIFGLEVPEVLRPKPTVLVAGFVINCTNYKGVITKVRVYKNNLQTLFSVGHTDPKNGQFKLALPTGEKYIVVAEHNPAYETSNADTVYIDLSRQTTMGTIEINPICFQSKDTATNQIPPPRASILPTFSPIYFGFDSYGLDLKASSLLRQVVDTMLKYPKMNLLVEGHTDSKGTHGYNWTLGIRRAAAAIQFLENKGIQRTRIFMKGQGEDKPIALNSTLLGQTKNRRVELQATWDMALGKEIEYMPYKRKE